jgi:phage terminase large subunit GpA-like protein
MEGVDAAKEALYARLKIREPVPAYCHFRAGGFRLNRQADQIDAMVAARSAGDAERRSTAQQLSAGLDRKPWIEARDWFNRRS